MARGWLDKSIGIYLQQLKHYTNFFLYIKAQYTVIFFFFSTTVSKLKNQMA